MRSVRGYERTDFLSGDLDSQVGVEFGETSCDKFDMESIQAVAPCGLFEEGDSLPHFADDTGRILDGIVPP